jgi:hypothetical protein
MLYIYIYLFVFFFFFKKQKNILKGEQQKKVAYHFSKNYDPIEIVSFDHKKSNLLYK